MLADVEFASDAARQLGVIRLLDVIDLCLTAQFAERRDEQQQF